MLKITSRNEKLNRRMARKETTRFLHKLFYCFFVSSTLPRRLKNYRRLQTTKKKGKVSKISFKTSDSLVSKHKLLNFQVNRYCLNWQFQLLWKSSFTKTRTICFLTGRSRSIYRHFRLSRLKLREYTAVGFFTGLSKASW